MNANDPLYDLKYPVGRFEWRGDSTPDERSAWIDSIAATPARLREALDGLDDSQLDTPYRHGGWTVRQVAHHVPDSHMNAYIRFKFALTETDPLIKPYDESAWANLADTASVPVNTSVALLDGLHLRWVAVLRSMSSGDWRRSYVHPEMGKVTLDRAAGLYAWHGRHHIAHITGLRTRRGWI